MPSYCCLFTGVVVNDHMEVSEGACGDTCLLLQLLTLTPFKDLFATAKGERKASLEKRDAPVPIFFFSSRMFWQTRVLLRAIFKLYQAWVCSLKKEIRQTQASTTQKERQTCSKERSETEGFQNGRW